MLDDKAAELSNKLYEAAFLPELWPTVCKELAEYGEAYSCSIINIRPDNRVDFVTSPNLQDEMIRFSEGDIRSPLPARQLAKMPFSFQRDVDLLTEKEIDDDPVKNIILRPIGLKWQMGDALLEPSGHMLVFDLIRRTSEGPFSAKHLDAMNRLRPDLARAVFTASRVAFQGAQSTTRALAMIGLPAAIVGDDGAILSMNPEFEALAPEIAPGAGNRLLIQNRLAQNLYVQALSTLSQLRQPECQSIPLARTETLPAMIINLVPVRRQARDLFSRSAAVVIVNKIGQVGPPDVRVLCGLFDLTASEARVAREIVLAHSPETAAERLGLTVHTVRTHLKRIFLKTATSRQAELVALLTNLVSPRQV